MSERPNILVILSDQLRRDALGVYGDPNIVTPNIDRLANAGLRFQNACSTYPICVPYRFTLMTGEYGHSRLVPAIEWRMSPSERTLADEFNEAGYHTVYIGKWHLYGGHGLLPGHTPRKANKTPVPVPHQGRWQKWLAFELANRPHDTFYFEDDDPVPKPLGTYQTDGLFDLAFRHLAHGRPQDRPFCCVLSVEPPHFPAQAPAELEARWLDTEIELPENFMLRDAHPSPGVKMLEADRGRAIQHRKLYYAMIENLDANVGRMLEFLEEQGLADDTVIVFTSDHGEMGGAHCEPEIIKDHPFEESIGVPLLIADPRFPDRAGTVIDEPTCSEDLFPTLLGLAGLSPRDEKPGVDLTPLIEGPQDTLPRAGVMLEFVHDLRTGSFPVYNESYWRGFRTRRFKYTVIGDAKFGGRPWQFYDLATDPREMRNLIDDEVRQEDAARLHRLLRARLEETADHYVLAPAYGEQGLNIWGGPDAPSRD